MTEPELLEALASLPGWVAEGGAALTRTHKFASHSEAMGFVVRVAMAAEVLDHHPDLRIVYDTVHLRLSSHDTGGVTARDIRLARKINELLD
jgi:4a-hydroxytetrahydrobiopterin dehydratase